MSGHWLIALQSIPYTLPQIASTRKAINEHPFFQLDTSIYSLDSVGTYTTHDVVMDIDSWNPS
jgi:hypothetical protein